jgi:CheY-like chemotaxis protein
LRASDPEKYECRGKSPSKKLVTKARNGTHKAHREIYVVICSYHIVVYQRLFLTHRFGCGGRIDAERGIASPQINRADKMTEIRILHVDDESDIREVVDLSLSLDPDFTVRACASGGEAIQTASEWSPLLILLDVMMPGMDGPTTLSHLRKDPRTSAIPVVFMTARAQASEVAQFISLGAQGVISKPFDPMTLASQVQTHLQALGPQS